MTTYVVNTSNWNDPLFWASVSETSIGHTLDFSSLPSSYSVTTDASTGIITINDGFTTYTIGETGVGGTHTNLGGTSELDFFTTLTGSQGDDDLDGTSDDDTFVSGDTPGNDTIDGLDGTDTLDLTGVTGSGIDLSYSGPFTGTATIGSDTIAFTNVEIFFLSEQADTVTGGTTFLNVYTGGGTDYVDGSSTGDGIHLGTGNDTAYGHEGLDHIRGVEGDDYIVGGADGDLLRGGSGDDTIYGDDDPADWPTATIDGSNFADTASGYTITGQNVVGGTLSTPDVANVINPSGTRFGVNGSVSNVESGTDDQIAYDQTSGLSEVLTVSFDDPQTEVSFSFDSLHTASNGDQGYYEVYNDGVLVTSGTFTEDGAFTSDGTVTISGVGEFDEIRFSATLQTDSNAGSDYYLTGITFTPVPPDPGNEHDTIDGGEGSDLVFGGYGDDQITVDQGDTVSGGDGDDYFTLVDDDTTGTGNDSISITGGEGDETGGDTLQLTSDVSYDDITFTNTDDADGGLSGNFTLADGTYVEFSEIENIICFTPGAMILTQTGERPVETLRIGDMVVTRDNGVQPIRWIGRRTVHGKGRFAPVHVASSVLDGSRSGLLVSPQHRLLFTGYRAELLFGSSEVLVPAVHMVDGHDVTRQRMNQVTYIHLMFDHHEIIYADGIATESFHAGDVGISALCEATREELFAIFPELRDATQNHGSTARPCLKRYEARLLVEANARPFE